MLWVNQLYLKLQTIDIAKKKHSFRDQPCSERPSTSVTDENDYMTRSVLSDDARHTSIDEIVEALSVSHRSAH